MNISHKGIGTGRGLPYALAAALKVAPGQQAAFTHYNKFAKQTAVQGECDLADAGEHVRGLIVDVSSKGDSCTVETSGFEFVKMTDLTSVAAGKMVTAGAAGVAVLIAGHATNAPTQAELRAGVWVVDAIDAAGSQVLIDLDDRVAGGVAGA